MERTLTIGNVGKIHVRSLKEGDSGFYSALPVEQVLDVKKKALSIRAEQPLKRPRKI